MGKRKYKNRSCLISKSTKFYPDVFGLSGALKSDTFVNRSGPSCSKLETSLVNVSLKFHMLISNIGHYLLLKKCEKLLHCKSFSHFLNKKISVDLVIKW